MKSINYLKGDATNPMIEGNKLIIHICNDCSPGKWGAGFVLSLSKKWKEPEEQYRKWSTGQLTYKPYSLGQVQFVKVAKDVVVGNMIAQHGTGFHNGQSPIRYDALDKCLKEVSEIALKYKASVCGPRFGSGLAGGDWSEIEKLIVKNLCDKDIEVYIFDLK